MSFVAYNGPSQITGEGIIAVVTWNSSNSKTGDMNQLWMLPRDRNPWEAVKAGEDQAVCGECPLAKNQGCYVQVPQAPLRIWRTYQMNRYSEEWDLWELKRRPIRLGAYGDPAAVPREVIKKLVGYAPGWTGFTHQWKEPRHRWLRDYCMASVQNMPEAMLAMKKGFRFFRVKPPHITAVPLVESVCPASDEADKKLQCVDCLFCSGLKGKGMGSVVTDVHGLPATKNRALESVT